MKTSLLATLMLAAVSAQADELVMHTVSMHHQSEWYRPNEVAPSGSVNNINPGMGFVTDAGWTAGGYRNSFRHNTLYVGRQFMWDIGTANRRQVQAGFALLATSGYKVVSNKNITPGGGLALRMPLTEKVTAVVVGFPKVGTGTIGYMHLAIGYKL